MKRHAWYPRHLPQSVADLKRLGRQIPGAAQLWAAWHRWHAAVGRGDQPVPPEVWDRQYRQGHWQYLWGLEEYARYSLLLGYLQYFAPGGAVLDVGCGEGILQERLRPVGYARYVGLDVSTVAIAQAAPRADATTRFVVGDAATYVPPEPFDAIVFNESLYYVHEPLPVVQRYASYLTAEGVILTSLYGGSARAQAIGRALRGRYRVLDEVTISHGARAWVCQVLGPTRPPACGPAGAWGPTGHAAVRAPTGFFNSSGSGTRHHHK
jgi:SAM-dependent methyltransferase